MLRSVAAILSLLLSLTVPLALASARKVNPMSAHKAQHRELPLGRPVTLRFAESARGPNGFTLTFDGIANVVPEQGPERLYINVTLKEGNEEGYLRFEGGGRALTWRAWSVTLQDFMFSYTEVNTATFVVERTATKGRPKP